MSGAINTYTVGSFFAGVSLGAGVALTLLSLEHFEDSACTNCRNKGTWMTWQNGVVLGVGLAAGAGSALYIAQTYAPHIVIPPPKPVPQDAELVLHALFRDWWSWPNYLTLGMLQSGKERLQELVTMLGGKVTESRLYNILAECYRHTGSVDEAVRCAVEEIRRLM